ncbi:hypothetical protein BY996DRAFT_4383121 [Phakopsora pachyrhizi]|uniref:Uncharacterized protein n=1 Tax=Phakopsora pachyrhizi TaxID=170000 RepID=A0AAV0BG36_PHAPC|nr:hypothetical protein BY996DRAFT_4383121 [Phakopsora pachyrhizi]CAH7686249.1 hypothetical protein PPACK8108_LOCUS20871 [Phakopsora pachyrhizi]
MDENYEDLYCDDYGYNPASEISGFYSDDEDEGVFVPASEMVPYIDSATIQKEVETTVMPMTRRRALTNDFKVGDDALKNLKSEAGISDVQASSPNSSYNDSELSFSTSLSSQPTAQKQSDSRIHLFWAREHLKRLTLSKIIPGFQPPDHRFNKKSVTHRRSHLIDDFEEFKRMIKLKPRDDQFGISAKVWLHRQKRLENHLKMQPGYNTISEE